MRIIEYPIEFRVQGWSISFLVHGVFVAFALFAVSEVKFVPNQNVFRWEVAVQETPTTTPESTASAAVEPQPPAPAIAQPTPSPAQPTVQAPKPAATRRVEPKQVVEHVQPEPKPLMAQPLERQIIERKPVEQTQPLTHPEASRPVEPITPRPVETVTHEKTQVVQERRAVQDQASPVLTSVPKEVDPIQKQESVASALPQEATPVTREVAAIESPQPVSKKMSPVGEPAPISTETAPIARTAPVESPQPVTRDVAPIVKESPPVESTQPMVARTDPGPPAEAATPQTPLHPPTQERQENVARETAPASTTMAKAFPTPRADFGWLTQALWRRIEQLKRYPHKARMNRWEGTVVVRAVIRQDGHFAELTMERSSGHDVLDEDAIELLRKASPLMLKHELGRPELTIRIPISYKLE